MAVQSPLSTLNATQEAVSTAQNMGGIPVTETPTSSETSGAIVKAPTVKGGFSVPGNVALDPTQTAELLSNMQQMIDKRTGGWHDFMGGLQDTLALATPPRLGGPTQAMATRAQQKRQEQEDIFNMRAQMAALKAGANQAQYQREMMGKILGGGGAGAGGESAAPSVFGGAQQIPTEVRQAMALDPVNAASILQKYLTTTASETAKARLNPAWSALTEVIGKDGQIEKVPLWQATEIAMSNPNNPKNRAVMQAASEVPGPAPAPATGGGVNQFNVGNVRPAGQSTGFQQPKSYEEGIQIMDQNLQAYGKKGIDTLRGVISRWAPPSENDTETYIKNAAQRLGISPDQKIDLSNPVQRQAIGTAIMLQEKGPKQLFAAAPTGTMTDVGGGGAMPPRAAPGESPESLKIRQEEWRKDQESRRAGLTKQVEDTTKFIDSLTAAGEAANTKLGMLKEIKDAAINNPDDFYVSGKTKGKLAIMGGLVNYARDQGGEQKAKDREKSLQPYFYSEDSIKRRENIDAYAGQLAMGSSREMLGDASVRLGAQIEKMFIDFKGLGTAMPAETNRKAAEMYEVIMERKRDQAIAAKDYLKSHPTATPTEIMNSPAYKAVDERASERLVKLFGKAAEVTPQDMAREELRRRKEAQQGAK